MIYRPLGLSGLNISVLGYGCWKLAGKGWPGVNISDARRAVEKSLESGINFFDTAPIYGFGMAEQLLGDIIGSANVPAVIATKCGLIRDSSGRITHNLSRDSILREVQQSLVRLKTDRIGLYQIHWPDPDTPLEESLETLAGLQKQGVIQNIGVCNFSLSEITAAARSVKLASVQCGYNFLERAAASDIIPWCLEHTVSFLAYSPFAQGLLTESIDSTFVLSKNDVRRMNPLFSDREKFDAAIEERRKLGSPPERRALEFAVHTPGVTSALVSMTRTRHVEMNCKIVNRCG